MKQCESIRLDLLDMLGSGYVIDHCISAFLDSQRQKLYQEYIAENIRIIGENTALFESAKYIKKTFYDIMHRNKKTEEKSGEEIAEEVAGLIGKG